MNFLLFLFFWVKFFSSSFGATVHKKEDCVFLSDYWKNSSVEIQHEFVVPAGNVPRYQYEVSWGIHFPLFFLLNLYKYESSISQILCAFCVYSIFLCVPIYFGYWPGLQLRRINLDHKNNFISRQRWLTGPFFWLSEIIFLLPAEVYAHLQLEFNFPNRFDVGLIFVILGIKFFGIFDRFDSMLNNFAGHLAIANNNQNEKMTLF